jgi:mono/diheme cytochrome c family protein
MPEFTMKRSILWLLALCLILPAAAAELKIDLGHGVAIYDTETLLKRHDLRTINVPADVAFGRLMQWPYQLATIRKLDSVAKRFPAILPDSSLPAAGDVQHGFVVFQHTCFACHTLNGEGDAKLGPDLNIPHNPIEYLRADLLRAYIRNPQSLRQWPQAKMRGFDTQALSDADLDAVLAYLRHMAGRKAPDSVVH